MISKLNDGKYVKIFQFPKLDACQFMQTIYKEYIHPKVSKCSNLPDPEVCPIPSGKYDINCSSDMGEFDEVAGSLGVGNYSTALSLMNDGEPVDVIRIFSSIVKNPETA